MALRSQALGGLAFNFHGFPALQATGGYTACAWVRVFGAGNGGTSASNGHALWCHYENGLLGTTERCVSIRGDGSLHAYIFGVTNSTAGGRAIPDGNWHHYAVSYNGAELSFLVDGDIAHKVAASGSVYSYSSPRFRVGSANFLEGGSGTQFTSQSRALEIADVAHWNAGLSLGEIRQIALGGRLPPAVRRQNLGAFIRFDARGAVDALSGTRGTIDQATAGFLSQAHPQIDRAWRSRRFSLVPSGGTDATANGVTLTATASLIAGAATAASTAAAATLTATSSIITGSATAASVAAGVTLTATASLIPGSASGSSTGTANGVTLTATASLIAGTATAASTAAGATLTATASIIAGSASGSAAGTANGVTLTGTATLITGAATASSTATGQTLNTTASLIAGSASGGAAGTASGATVAATASLIAGAATSASAAPSATWSLTATVITGGAVAGNPAAPRSRRIRSRGAVRAVSR